MQAQGNIYIFAYDTYLLWNEYCEWNEFWNSEVNGCLNSVTQSGANTQRNADMALCLKAPLWLE